VPADLVPVVYGVDPVPFPADSELARIATNEWGGIVVEAKRRARRAQGRARKPPPHVVGQFRQDRRSLGQELRRRRRDDILDWRP